MKKAFKVSQVQFSQQFKDAAVQKYLSRGSRSVHEIAQELGTTSTSIFSWARSRRNGTAQMNFKTPRRPEEYSPFEKTKAVVDYLSMPDSDRGEWLRRTGLTSEKIESWKGAAYEGLGNAKPSPESKADKRRIEELERQLRRKDRALAETAALLVLQKKISEIFNSTDES